LAMRLSDITENTVLSATTHARYPGAHCAFFGVAGMVPLIRNSHALMVGPAVCLYNAKLNINLRALTSDPRPDNLLLLLLDQEDIIFGAHEKVRQGVLEADKRYRPEVLFVVTTCTQEIIGEDFDAAVAEIRPQLGARLLVIHTDNFTCGDASPGIERTYLALAELMRPGKATAKSVNLIGLRAPGGRGTEPVRLLEDKGVRIQNVIPSNSTMEEISHAPEASLNIVLEHYALPLAKKMREDFGTPYIYTERPYTPDAIGICYRRIAEQLHIDFDLEIRTLKEKAMARVLGLKDRFAGKRFILGVQPGRSFDLARLLVQLGMQPLLLYANRILPDDPADIRALLAEGVDPLVRKSGDALDNDRLLAELKPDFFIGHGDRRLLARLDIQARNLMRASYAPGFAGTELVIRLLEQPPAGSGILNFKEQTILNGEGVSPWRS
jgi:nitrogenase molybdenum-cofactor synthesis protein NifE